MCARSAAIVSYVMPNAGHTYIVGDDLFLIEGYCLQAKGLWLEQTIVNGLVRCALLVPRTKISIKKRRALL